ncbi:MAG: BsuPI-related putative proteinase inhibitor [Blastocatellia bacterium]|nr:BsuPI-related putative proteinase inhibitor [Blastocatellia bacterium]
MSEQQALSARLEAAEHAGRAIRLKLRLRNESGHRLTLTLGGRPAYNFLVKRPDGTLVWEWQRGKIIQQILERRSLDPGEEVIFEETWKFVDARGRRVPAGEYVVQGVVNLEPPERLLTDPLLLRVPPPKSGRKAAD